MFQAQPELFDAGGQILYRNNLSWHLLQCTPSMMTALPTERERSEALGKESHRGWWDLWICKPVNWLFTQSGIFELVSFFVTGFLMNQNELFVASIHGPGLSHCRVPKGPIWCGEWNIFLDSVLFSVLKIQLSKRLQWSQENSPSFFLCQVRNASWWTALHFASAPLQVTGTLETWSSLASQNAFRSAADPQQIRMNCLKRCAFNKSSPVAAQLRSCSLHGKCFKAAEDKFLRATFLSITFLTHNISRKSTQFEKSRKFLACVTHPEALKCSRTVKLQPDTDSNPKPFIFQRMTSSFAWLPPWPQRNDQSLKNWQECQFFKCCRSTNQSIQEFQFFNF